jgi:hypothetical protein
MAGVRMAGVYIVGVCMAGICMAGAGQDRGGDHGPEPFRHGRQR